MVRNDLMGYVQEEPKAPWLVGQGRVEYLVQLLLPVYFSDGYLQVVAP